MSQTQTGRLKTHCALRVLFGTLVLGLLLSHFPARAAEYRAFWLDAFHNGFYNQSQVDALLGVPGTSAAGTIREANCNAVIIQVRKRADVCYPSGVGEPYMSGLSPANFNALAALIKAAHDTTGGKKRIEVHCWSVAFKTAKGLVYSQHSDTPTGSLTTFDNYWPTRLSSTTGAENTDGAFDPGHPKALEYLVNAHMDLVNFQTTAGPDGTDGHIDGIHYDYIRFEANTEGYNPTSVARYNARYGLSGDPASTSEQFKQWRRDQCTAFVRQMYARIQKTKPWVKQSGAVVTWHPEPTSSTRAAFQATRPYYDVYSDWDSWQQEGIVDMTVQMAYFDWAGAHTADYIGWMNFGKDRKFNRHMIIGPGIYMNSLGNAILELQMTREPSPAGNYSQGFCGYSYAVPYASGTWSGFTNSLVPNVTPTWDDIPTMPWKTSPATGHIMGTVTIFGTGAWADGAKVSLAGPVSRVQTNDGTGFYAFIDLPVGTYTVTANLSGHPSATGTVAVAVGEVTGNMYEINLVLGGSTPPSITAQPQSQTVTEGGNATFTVSATGTAPLSYQWRFNEAPIITATNSTYTLSNVQPTDAGSYSVVVANSAGSITSSNAVLTVETNSTTDIILDNTNPAVTFAGDWQTASATAGRYGPDYRFAGTAAGGLSNACFRPYIYNSGYYDVYIWYTTGSNRATNAPWSIVYDGGSITVPVNQQLNGGSWVSIGASIPFVQGTNGCVILSNDTGYSGKVVMADAVRFVYVGPLETNLILTATASGGGAVYRFPEQAAYDRNSVVTLIAAPVLGWDFAGWSGDASDTANPLNLTLIHSLSITGSFTSAVPDLVVDNTNAAFTGSWTTSTTTDDFEVNYRYASATSGGATATATFTPTISTAGNYDVYVWYPTLSSNRRSDGAPYTIVYDGGSTNVIVSQQSGQGSWQLIAAAIPFAVGTSGSVQLANNTGEGSNRRVAADAARWVYSVSQDSAPVIIAQPQSQTADAGSSATFSTLAAGTAPLSYQWRLNGTNIAAATDSAYVCSNLQPGDAGGYSVVVNNAVGSVISSNAVLTVIGGPVNIAPSISQQPQDQNVNQGGNAAFTVTASGSPAPSYQWRKNGTPIAEATDTSFTVVNAQPADAGGYSVVVSNIAGTVTSADAVLTVNVPPAITAQPQDQNVNQTSNAVFSVAATGTPAPSYQWRKNATPIPEATDTSFTVVNAQPADAGGYSVVVSNIAGTVTSADAVLTVNVPPAITTQPQDQNVNQTSNAVFSVAATGTPAPSYQWRKNGTPIAEATNSSFTVVNAQPADAGGYSVVVSNIAGTVTSADAVLTVNVPPAITTQPQDQNVNQTSNAVFSVAATGTPAPSYQWRKNGKPIAEATDTSFTVVNAQPADAGGYSVVVSNIAGTVTSADAVLTVNVPPAITTQPQDQNVNQTSNAVFSVAATGTPAPSYQWRKNGTPIAEATDTSFTVPNAQLADAGGYSVVVSNIAGTVTSADAVLTVNVPPAITIQPQDQNVNQTSNAVFSVAATGTPAPSYQWRKNGTPITEATDTSFTVVNAQPADAGGYSVVVSNIAGTVTSADAVLTVNVPPGITGQPQSVTVAPGSNVTFTVSATGTEPLSYQWRFNGTNLNYATASTYTCNNAQARDAGSYSVVVSNIAGTVTSADALLTVTEPAPLRIDSINLLSDGQVRLRVNGSPGHYAVEASSNLFDWSELTNFTTTGDAFDYVDIETDSTTRFYRVRLTP